MQIGGLVVEAVDMDVDRKGIGWGPYLRGKVAINILHPLIHGIHLNMARNKIWFLSSMRDCHLFCFKYGIIKHRVNRCEVEVGNGLMHGSSKQQYGAWIKASNSRDQSKSRRFGYGVKKQTGTQSLELHGEDDDMARDRASYGKGAGNEDVATDLMDKSKNPVDDQGSYNGKELTDGKDHGIYKEIVAINVESSLENPYQLLKEGLNCGDIYMASVQEGTTNMKSMQEGNLEQFCPLTTCVLTNGLEDHMHMSKSNKAMSWKRRASGKQVQDGVPKSIGHVDQVSPKLGSKRLRRGGGKGDKAVAKKSKYLIDEDVEFTNLLAVAGTQAYHH